ncbi:MAG: restriction endonuclease [Eggerthellaceae bacterium]|nr:restriction endonuclease [Eggerthellaceae bacterium]
MTLSSFLLTEQSPLPLIASLCFLLLALILVFVILVRRAYRLYLRNEFRRIYGVDITPDILPRRNKLRTSNSLVLHYPYWSTAKSDGSQDRRYRHNYLIAPPSFVFLEDFALSCPTPFQAAWLAKTLRAKGFFIARCPEEERKYRETLEHNHRYRTACTIDTLIASFSDDPTEFEEYCAQLFRDLGYQANTTRKTADGGYDIVLTSPAGATGLAECKLYHSKIGRPFIQKLIGANHAVGATELYFITTSEFTNEAIACAAEANVVLIDKHRLNELIDSCRPQRRVDQEVSADECTLSYEDIAAHYPPDAAPPFFPL